MGLERDLGLAVYKEKDRKRDIWGKGFRERVIVRERYWRLGI